mmetsp:Transcript_41473/g.63282  ORF Transcript_41473/g.63282 Transcript_41473/m.63282 type:complete len:265 (+) Transcript_41473:3233-4027(+)
MDEMLAEEEPSKNILISDIISKNEVQIKAKPSEAKRIASALVESLWDSFTSKIKEKEMKQMHRTIAKYEVTADQIFNKQKKMNEIKKQSKPLELFNPQLITDPSALAEEVVEYHEGLLNSKKQVKEEDIYKYLMESINQAELKSQIKQVMDMKQRQTIENDLIKSDDYSNELLAYLLQFEILHNEEDYDEALIKELSKGINYLTLFLKNLTQPIQRDLLLELKSLAKQETGMYQHFESCLDPLKHPILPIDMYLDIEKQREFEY